MTIHRRFIAFCSNCKGAGEEICLKRNLYGIAFHPKAKEIGRQVLDLKYLLRTEMINTINTFVGFQ